MGISAAADPGFGQAHLLIIAAVPPLVALGEVMEQEEHPSHGQA